MTYTPIAKGTQNWDVPLNAALAQLDANITSGTSAALQATNNLSDLTNVVQARSNLGISAGATVAGSTIYNVKDYGAVGNGVADDKAAIAAAITAVTNAGGGIVYFPTGTYNIGSALTPTVAMRFTGGHNAIIKSTASDIFNFNSNYMHPGNGNQVGIIEVDHLILDATGGHVFNNANINQGSFHDLQLYARSSNKGIWNSSTTLLQINFRNIISTVYGATRTVPAWSITGISTADVAGLAFSHCLFQNNDSDATQYQVLIQSTAGTSGRYYNEQVAFRDCYFERPFGGAVKILSGQGTLFENCRVYDIFTGATVGNSMFYMGIGTNSTWPSTNTTFINCGRDLQGPNGSSTWDIQLESGCIQTTIMNYDVRDIPTVFDGHPFLNLGNSTSVTLINNADQTLTNASGTGFNNITSDGTASGALAPTNFSAVDLGFLAWSYDSAMTNGATGAAPVLGTVTLAQVIVRQPVTTTGVSILLTANGGTLTSGQNFLALYNSSGTRVAVTADQTSAWGSGATKYINSAWTSSAALTPGKYWVAILANGTTAPNFGRAAGTVNSTLYNGTLSASLMRFANSSSTSQTSMPASITPSGNTANTLPYWVALT